MRPLLILRPEPGASETAARARNQGLEPLVRPLFEVAPRLWTMPEGRFDALMLTSANAVRHGGGQLEGLRHLPVFTVGLATAEAAHDAGFANVTAGTSGVDALLRHIATLGKKQVLHLAGRDRVTVLQNDVSINAVTVYASDILPAPRLPENAVALLHSARAAKRFGEIAALLDHYDVVAISPAVADVAGLGWASCTAAQTPDDMAMLALAARLCKGDAATNWRPSEHG